MSDTTTANFRLSPQQERLWEQQTATPVPFLTGCEVFIEGPLDELRLRDVVQQAAGRHESLRTVLDRQTGFKTPFQIVKQTVELSWNSFDLTKLDASTQVEKMYALAKQSHATLDLEQGPNLLVNLFALGMQSHAISITIPALCADRRSLQNLMGEIGRAYAGSDVNGEAMQYLDVVEWQRELLTSDDSRPGRDFWRQYFRKLDLNSGNSLLSSFKTNPEGLFSPAVVLAKADSALASRFPAFCAGQGAAEADLLLAAWQIFLWRITGQSGIATACEFDGRKYAELDDAVGLFARYLPVQSEITPSLPFRLFLEQVKSTVAEMNNWQDTFTWAAAEPDLRSYFPTAFEYADVEPGQVYSGTKFTFTKLETCCEAFELKLSVRQGPDLSFEFHYDASRLERETVELWARCFLALLTAAVDAPDTTVSRLPLLDEALHHRLVVEWNNTAADYPRDLCFHQLFETQAALTPDRPALRCEEKQLTYRELNEQANQLSFALSRVGVEPGALVGLCLGRGIEMIVALLAIFKAGGAYVPLAADQPKARLTQQLADITVLLTEEKFLSRMPPFAGKTICLDRDSWQEGPRSNPNLNQNSSTLAYVIYTSGSTGVPKGVAVRHRNLINYAWFIRRMLKLETHPEGLHFATVSTLAADLGNTCIYPSLLSGGCLHVISYDVAADSQRLSEYTGKHPCDVLKIVPSHLTALLDSGGGREVLPRKYLVLGGEAFRRGLLEQISALNPTCRIVNHYGPTETTIGSLTLSLEEYRSASISPKKLGATIPLGKPIANTSVYILDTRQELLPPGIAGELYIAGDGVTAGYLNQPERTEERFLPDPFAETPGQKMYRTGDLARFLPEGDVEFLGRADDQVKIRGFRVELGEVEAVLTAQDGVKQAVVIARPDERGDNRLAAYVTASRDQNLSVEDIRAWLKEQLPEHMIPAAIMVLSRMPLTANGKIDRQNLPEPQETLARAQSDSDPRSQAETLIAGTWGEVLRRGNIGLDDNFFDIGGHSLLATQVVSRLRRSLEIDLQLRVMFDCPTVRQLATWVDRARREGNDALPPPLVPVSRDRLLPLSFVQQRLWVIDQLQPGNPVYNIPRTLRMKGTLDTAALQRALDEVLRRHESQRTTFEGKDGEPVQIIAERLRVPLPLRDLSGLPEEDREPAARQIAKEEARQPFDLKTGPLVRAQLLRLAPDDHLFLLTVHHIISDGWSAGIFIRELGALYEAFTQGKPSPLPELVIQCADYAVWQRNWLQGDILKRQVDYWREHLRGAPPVLELPSDQPRSETASLQGASEVVEFSAEFSDSLKAFSRKEDVTLFITLLAGFQALLARYVNQEHIVVGTDVANRTSLETEALIGCFINVLALHTDLSGNPSFRELLGRVRKVALDAWAHQDMPFDKLVEELQPERSTGHNPIVQVLFVMQNIPAGKREIAGLELIPFPMPVNYSKFDLAVFMAERAGQLVGYWVYRTDLFERNTILRFASQLETLLANALANPETRLNALEILGEEEKQQQDADKKARKRLQQQGLMATLPKTVGRELE